MSWGDPGHPAQNGSAGVLFTNINPEVYLKYLPSPSPTPTPSPKPFPNLSSPLPHSTITVSFNHALSNITNICHLLFVFPRIPQGELRVQRSDLEFLSLPGHRQSLGKARSRGLTACAVRVAGWEAGDGAFFQAQVGPSLGQSSVISLHSTFLPPVTPPFASGQVLLSALALYLHVAPDKVLLELSSPGHHPAFCESDLHSSTGDE